MRFCVYIRSRGFMEFGTPAAALLRRFWLGFVFLLGKVGYSRTP